MKRNSIAREILAQTPPETRQFVRRYAELTVLVQEILERKGMNQKDLAEKMGKKPSQISKWLRGEHNFTLKSLTKLEVELGEELFHIPVKRAQKAAKLPSHRVFSSELIVYRNDDQQMPQAAFTTVQHSKNPNQSAIAA